METVSEVSTAAVSSTGLRDRDLLGKPVGVRLEDVHRIHKMGEIAVPALNGVSLTIAPGEFVAIMGPSGSGKSTLLNLIGGLDRPTSGRVVIGGVPIQDLKDRRLADYRLQRVGTVFQSFNLVQSLSALGNVALPMALAGTAAGERRQRAQALLEKVGVGDRASFRPARMSGGQQQRVSIARALSNRPGLLLADEPTGNLDDEAGDRVMELLHEVHALGATVIMVTHDPEIGAQADRIIRLRNGVVVEQADQPESKETTQGLTALGRLGGLETLRMGVSSVLRRRLRTTLSAGGVAVGIGAMSFILSFTFGTQNALNSSLSSQGALRQVTVGATGVGGGAGAGGAASVANHKTLDQGALNLLGRQAHVTASWGSLSIIGGVQDSTNASLSDVTARSLPPRDSNFAAGSRSLQAGSQPASDTAPEAVVSSALATKMGLHVGDTIRFSGLYSGLVAPGSGVAPASKPIPLALTVVGLDSAGAFGTAALSISLPYATMTGYWTQMRDANNWKSDEFSSLTLVADSTASATTVKDEVTKLGYQATATAESVKSFTQILSFIGLGLTGIAAVALLVACLGIVNTMYTSVLERTREIGILKALGARSGDVRNMFMAEAALIGLIGGAVGIAVTAAAGVAGNAIVNSLAHQQGIPISLNVFQTAWWLVVLSVAGAGLVSALSGFFPALRAASLDPVVALRYE